MTTKVVGITNGVGGGNEIFFVGLRLDKFGGRLCLPSVVQIFNSVVR